LNQGKETDSLLSNRTIKRKFVADLLKKIHLADCLILFHPDYTVGTGFSPVLLDLSDNEERSRAPQLIWDTADGDFHPALRISHLP